MQLPGAVQIASGFLSYDSTGLKALLATAIGCLIPITLSANQYVCGWLKEPAAFLLWTWAAGETSPDELKDLKPFSAESITHRARDGHVLAGYRVTRPDRAVTASVLVVQGNAQLVSSLIKPIRALVDSGVEVLMYDYRGYGNSKGSDPSLQAIVEDFRSLISEFVRRPSPRKSIYAMSFGGVVAMKALHGSEPLSLLILDSVPSSVEQYGCPRDFSPQERLPFMRFPLTIVVSEGDETLAASEQLGLPPGSRSPVAVSEFRDRLHHPFTPKTDQRVRLETLIKLISTHEHTR